jgi:hypothetical protein
VIAGAADRSARLFGTAAPAGVNAPGVPAVAVVARTGVPPVSGNVGSLGP